MRINPGRIRSPLDESVTCTGTLIGSDTYSVRFTSVYLISESRAYCFMVAPPFTFSLNRAVAVSPGSIVPR